MENKQIIMVVEDEKVIRDFLSAILSSNGYKVITAKSAKDALSLSTSHCPDLVLLDLGLPDQDGLAVLKAIREWCGTPIIVVSARQHEREKVQALDLGADDYVTKPFNNNELLARIRTALRRGTAASGYDTRSNFTVGELSIDYGRRRVEMAGNELHLTPIEYRLLTLLSAHAGRVLTHESLLREIWGPYVSDNRILRVNMANLRRKIEVNPADPRYILTEIGVGYRITEE